jgi:hypothetical protein
VADLELWHDALTRRLRSLLKTEPLHRLRRNEGRLTALLPHDDPTALCVKALEVLVDALGLRPGATRGEIDDALLPILAAQDRAQGVAADRERHLEVVRLVVGVLLNDAGRRQAYEESYLGFEDGQPVRRTLRFRLASEQEALDGAIVVRAEADGINLFLRSLDVDLEDAQAATEAVMRAQLARGRLDLALQTAREAQIRSLQYEDKIRGLIRQTHRDIGRVDWRHEVPTLLAEARRHLEERIEAERQLRETAQANLERLAGSAEAAALARICAMLDDCFARHLSLQQPLMSAYEVFRAEQERQRFAPIALRPLPALEEEVLRPTLARSRAEALAAAEAFAAGASPARAPLLLDLARLWDRLLRPRPQAGALGRDLDEGGLAELAEAPPLFDDALADRVDGLLGSLRAPEPLSRVLTRLASPREAHFAVLRCLQGFAPERESALPLVVEAAGAPLTHPPFAGDDLVLAPRSADGD